MAFTYDPTTDRGWIRLTVGDTDSTDPLLTDAEVDEFTASRQVENEDGDTVVNLPAAAADAAGAVAAKFARRFNFATDGQRFDLAQRVGHYQALEETLRRRAGGVSAPNPTT